MLAFVRVFAFYVAMAALLTWALFALGWNDALEMPGFEGTRTPTPVPKPAVEATPAKVTAVVIDVPPPVRDAERKPADVAAIERPSVKPPEPLPPAPAASAPQISAGAIGVTPPETRDKAKEAVVAVPAKPPLQAPQTSPQIPPVKRVEPAAKAAAVVTEPVRPAPQAAVIPAAPPAPVPPPAVQAPPPPPPAIRKVEPATTPDPQARAPTGQTTRRQFSRWAPQRRIAGFAADDLTRLLADAQKAPDDVPCVAFRDLAFTAGTPKPEQRASRQLALIAKALNGVAGRRIEIGSRLGPGRPMHSDKPLRAERVRVVRDTLIRYGISPDRLLVDHDDAFERVAEDVGRAAGGRVQSIGLCVHD
jgi:hypothetical protein